MRWPQGLLDLWRKGELQGGELLVKGGLVSFELRGVVLGCLAAGRTAPRFFFFLELWPIPTSRRFGLAHCLRIVTSNGLYKFFKVGPLYWF